MKNQRKVIKIEEKYLILKPLKDMEGWEKQGKKYSRKGLVNLLEKDIGFEFIVSDEIKREVEDYVRLCDYKKYMFENKSQGSQY